jgi:hypothetical protein
VASIRRKRKFAMTAAIFALFGVSAGAQLLPEDMLPPEEEVEEVRRYSVEIIVFEYSAEVSAGNETFAPVEPPPVAEPEIPEFGDPAVIAPVEESVVNDSSDFPVLGDDLPPAEEEDVELELIPGLSSIEFRALLPEELTMVGIHERLLELDAYEPVLWGGWTQTTHERELTPAIRLRALGTPPIHLDGTMTLFLKNYLHLVVDLTREQRIGTIQPIYRQEKSSYRGYKSRNDRDYSVVDTQIIQYQIQEDRLFRSGELRYYDHPKFGVLATVHRVEEDPDGETEADPEGRSMLSKTR